MSGLAKTSDANEVIAALRAMANPDAVASMARFGIVTETAIGVSNPDLRALSRKIGRNHDRALALWASGIREARLLAALTEEPRLMSIDQASAWAADCNSWELVDCVNEPIMRAGHGPMLIAEFAGDDREFVRRMAFSMICWGAVHQKALADDDVTGWLVHVEAQARDPRNFVRKAVNWALRQIGKRNRACHAAALALAEHLAESEDKTARWIGKDAVRELESEAVYKRLAKRD
ncbi:3-methyladenine DNA glycosylase AlkD [Rhizobium sp. SG_E_25_P2]|uniref:DNA alkylation repair protein n=1 Tax=Rhizobium sp. SG_E_25_P2 TaxID=2879942 RepID=UPI00247313A2|nr:DNA alkylation repair protein [Rhizobium sp. SG_E_25_P2]MDH6268051.1 3-methyladenine DNA glycosylase AlkD [Rhizobium sp. SG_E_25_P2]